MRYERVVLPIAALAAAGAAGYVLYRRRGRTEAEDEPGTFLYGYPLEVDEEELTIYRDDLGVDREMFPGFREEG